ncbi:hypothetical protein ACEU6E_09420 [Halorutilales archaeon Cl-col2-1]
MQEIAEVHIFDADEARSLVERVESSYEGSDIRFETDGDSIESSDRLKVHADSSTMRTDRLLKIACLASDSRETAQFIFDLGYRYGKGADVEEYIDEEAFDKGSIESLIRESQ